MAVACNFCAVGGFGVVIPFPEPASLDSIVDASITSDVSLIFFFFGVESTSIDPSMVVSNTSA